VRPRRTGSLAAFVLPLLASAGCHRTLPAPEGTFVPADAGAGDQATIPPADGGDADRTSAPDGGAGDAVDALRPTDAAAVCPPNAATLDVCGCGCCGAPAKNACYYPELGQSIATIPNPTPTNCQNVGCSAGVHNVCCAGPGSPAPAGVTYCYDVDRSATGGYHITMNEGGGLCTLLHVTAYSGDMFPISVPPGYNASGGLDGVCNGNAAWLAIGGLGSVAITNGRLDVHVVLFFDRNGTVDSKRIDVDQLDVLCNGTI